LNPERILDHARRRIEDRLRKSLPGRGSAPGVIVRAMRYSVLGRGKRIRPLITVESCRACGGMVSQALGAACAIEFVHTYSLIHDDLPAMDDDDTRRGRPTSHKVFGEAIAILAGDALLTRAFEVVAHGLEPDTACAVTAEIAAAAGAEGMVGGQALDLGYARGNGRARLINRVNLQKTARLFEASAKVGALCAGAGTGKSNALARFGRSLGLAFQIVDDVIDGGGYAEAFGRSRARDDARDLAGKALQELAVFGRRAATLEAIAEGVLERMR